MSLFNPDIGPYVLKDSWLGKAANNGQISTSLIEALENLLATGASSRHNLVQCIYFLSNLDEDGNIGSICREREKLIPSGPGFVKALEMQIYRDTPARYPVFDARGWRWDPVA